MTEVARDLVRTIDSFMDSRRRPAISAQTAQQLLTAREQIAKRAAPDSPGKQAARV